MSGGDHFDDGKPRVDLVPYELVEAAGHGMAYGIAKYGLQNWRRGIGQSRLAGSVIRHVFKWCSGEDIDPESKLPHLSLAASSLGMLLATNAQRPDLDDRGIDDSMIRYSEKT